MADSCNGEASAASAAAGSLPTKVEGMSISKNALRKALKQQQKEEEKRLKEERRRKEVKEVERVGTSRAPGQMDEDEMDPRLYLENRSKVLEDLKSSGENPYPHKFVVSSTILKYVEKFSSLADGEHKFEVVN